MKLSKTGAVYWQEDGDTYHDTGVTIIEMVDAMEVNFLAHNK